MSDPREPCPDCGHRNGDHHVITGCQHLEPIYDEDGRLSHHDRCKCRQGIKPPSAGTTCPRCHGEKYMDCGLVSCSECPSECRACSGTGVSPKSPSESG